VTAARAALAVDADEPRAVAVLARALGHKGWWESAHEALAQATSVAASRSAASAELWQLRGWASYRLGDTGRALSELEASVKLRKDDALTWNLIGVVRLDRSEPLEAIKALENARSHAPESVGVATNLGSAYRRAASLASGAEADELLRKAEKSYLAALGTGLGRGHGFAAAYLGLGLLYLDAPAFPGLDDVERLRRAIEYLGEIEGKDVEGVTRADIGRYLTDARRELEQARREVERDKGRGETR
jgi:tetratricopeptide (TPR) repeat protein